MMITTMARVNNNIQMMITTLSNVPNNHQMVSEKPIFEQ